MNWEAIGAIAELLGAVGVIASLVYLATQIRHSREQMRENTRALQAGTYTEWIGKTSCVFRTPDTRCSVDRKNKLRFPHPRY